MEITRRTKLGKSTYKPLPHVASGQSAQFSKRSLTITDNLGGIGKQPYSQPISDIEATRSELPPALKHLPESLYELAQFQAVRRWTTTEPTKRIIQSDIGTIDQAQHIARAKLNKRKTGEVLFILDADDEAAKGLAMRHSKADRNPPAVQGFISAWFLLLQLNAQAPACYKLTDSELAIYFRWLFPKEKYPADYNGNAQRYRKLLTSRKRNKQTRVLNLLPSPLPAASNFPQYKRLLRYTTPASQAEAYKLSPNPPQPIPVIYRATQSGKLIKQIWPTTAQKRVLLPRINNNRPGYYLEQLT